MMSIFEQNRVQGNFSVLRIDAGELHANLTLNVPWFVLQVFASEHMTCTEDFRFQAIPLPQRREDGQATSVGKTSPNCSGSKDRTPVMKPIPRRVSSKAMLQLEARRANATLFPGQPSRGPSPPRGDPPLAGSAWSRCS